jgi:hypothetical protein
MTATGPLTGTVLTIQTWITETIRYTTWLSDEIAAIDYTGTFTIQTAPAWYAPSLPRPLADAGWTFETLQSGIDTGERYNISAWASFTGYIASLPVQLIKSLYDLFAFLGPFGLFVIWLLVMLPLVLFFKAIIFLKNLAVGLYNLLMTVSDLILALVRTLADLFIPW